MISKSQKQYLESSYAPYWKTQSRSYGIDDSCQHVLEEIGKNLKPTDRVLDATVGNGFPLAETLSQRTSCFVGMDIAMPLLRECKRRAPSALLVRADIENPPFRTSSFEYVYCVRSTWHFENLKAALTALRTLVRTNGMFLFDFQSLKNFEILLAHLRFRFQRKIVNRLLNTLLKKLGKGQITTHVHEHPTWPKTIDRWLETNSEQFEGTIYNRESLKPFVIVRRRAGV